MPGSAEKDAISLRNFADLELPLGGPGSPQPPPAALGGVGRGRARVSRAALQSRTSQVWSGDALYHCGYKISEAIRGILSWVIDSEFVSCFLVSLYRPDLP